MGRTHEHPSLNLRSRSSLLGMGNLAFSSEYINGKCTIPVDGIVQMLWKGCSCERIRQTMHCGKRKVGQAAKVIGDPNERERQHTQRSEAGDQQHICR
jgi:hypothetical protein